jgi:hypothetical protein
MQKKNEERRRAKRKSLKVTCPSAVAVYGTRYAASMLDFSEIGARFTLEGETGRLEIQPGTEVSIDIHNQFGTTHCKGKIAWTCRIDRQCMLGVEFLEVASDKRDPLRCLMESPF